MTELDYLLKRFESVLLGPGAEGLVLCGSRYTAAVAERFGGHPAVSGVLRIGEGDLPECLPLITAEQALGQNPEKWFPGPVRRLVLCEHKTTDDGDYRLLEPFCHRHGLELYNAYGLDELAAHDEIATHIPLSLHGFLNLAREYDVVSIAAMDTLTSFERKEGCPQEDCLVLSPKMGALVQRLRISGRKVIFPSRNLVKREALIRFMLREGLFSDERMAAEDIYMRVGEDLGFRSIRERFPRERILHIGTSVANDCLIPRLYGIDTYRMVYGHAEDRPEKSEIPAPKAYLSPKEPIGVSPEKLQEQLSDASVVSFDLFDTLLIRKVLFPEDVFSLVSVKTRGICPEGFNYLFYRQSVRDLPGEPDLEEMYHEIGRRSGQPWNVLRQFMDAEIETEQKVLCARAGVAELLERLASEGKRIVLTSDMYLPSSILEPVLRREGITAYEKLFVSCEYHVRKATGLFRHVMEEMNVPGETIAHIGDDAEADGRAARAAGFRPILLPTTKELARRAGWGDILDAEMNLADQLLLGLVISRCFDDPFADYTKEGVPAEKRLERYAVAAVGTALSGYLFYLAREARELEVDGVLFAARDGFMSYKLYRRLRQKDPQLPPGQYFYTNRRVAALPNCALEETLLHVLHMPHGFAADELLRRGFALSDEKILPKEPDTDDAEYLLAHRPVLRETARRSRAAFEAYCRQSGLEPGKKYIFTDFVSEGTTQKNLEHYAPFALEGIYMAKPAYAGGRWDNIRYYLREGETPILRDYMRMESIFTSPEPALAAYAEDGSPVFQEEVRSAEKLELIRRVQKLALSFGADMIELFYYRGFSLDPALIESLYCHVDTNVVSPVDYDDWLRFTIKPEEGS